jgi:hypothetical protein
VTDPEQPIEPVEEPIEPVEEPVEPVEEPVEPVEEPVELDPPPPDPLPIPLPGPVTDDAPIDVEEPPGVFLFGAAAPTGGQIVPTPTVEIDGVAVPAAVTVTGGRYDGVVALDGFAVDWGTQTLLEQPGPASATLSLLDFTLTWAVQRPGRLLGLLVVLRHAHPEYRSGQTWSFFRGRISGVTVTPTRVAPPGGGRAVHAMRIDLTASSIELDQANKRPTVPTWPAESFATRAARLDGYTDGPVLIRPYWRTAPAAAVADAPAANIYDHLRQLYTSCGGDRLIYSPQARAYQWLARRHLDARSLGQLVRAFSGARGGEGVYATSVTLPATGYDTTSSRAYLDSGAVGYQSGLSKNQDAAVTRVAVDYLDPGTAAKATVSLAAAGIDEVAVGERALTFDSAHNATSWAQQCAAELLGMATGEAAEWELDTLRVDTAITGGFERDQQVDVLLRGHSTNHLFFLQRSWLPSAGFRPLVSVIGGRISYSGGHWQVEARVASVTTEPKQHAITWEEIDDGTPDNTVEWHDDPHPNGMHDTLTLDDLGYIGLGLGAAVIGPDQGYDQ